MYLLNTFPPIISIPLIKTLNLPRMRLFCLFKMRKDVFLAMP